ncbi:MAG: M15 family metallopeptidase [Bacteroidales bacterium]|nr:M15 family metallopeptidase [Bacteroidales bacterium]
MFVHQKEQNPDEEKFLSFFNDSVTKEFLLGKIRPAKDSMFIKVTTLHTERNIYLLRPVYASFIKMFEAAQEDGIQLLITSGHRSFVDQVCEWELKFNNQENIEKFSDDLERAKHVLKYRSMPGTSRHHWGTDIDLNSIKTEYFETEKGQMVYNWLKENAHLYGFYQPYTIQDENRPVGYCEEKWHWSYIPIAGTLLDKYLEMISKDDIKGFRGDKTVGSLDLITNWVCGIDKKLLEKKEDQQNPYQNWQLKLYGHWDDRLQQGNWYYMDTYGNINKIAYESGVVVEEAKNIGLSSGLESLFYEVFQSRFTDRLLSLK